ncbi:MAG TPA: riboflavin synthase [bacterium]|nr:riboflavin synthase [bacterium]
MFTGLIERTGIIKAQVQKGPGVVLEVSTAPGPYELAKGDSVAVDGLCLTATAVTADGFKVDVSGESLSRSTLKAARAGTRVNLERALRLGGRLGGHLVSGHVDAVGKIAERRPRGEFAIVTIAAPREVMALVIEKGSIAVDGVSLTVNTFTNDRFSMMIIPETLARTTLGWKKTGDEVNLETDLIGKYVARLLGKSRPGSDDAELMKKLMEEGFI